MNGTTDTACERGLGYLSSCPSSAFPQLMEKAKRFASYDGLAILILGETGTGKTLLARQLHSCSPRRDRPFVEVDCTSISSSLAESELFGHVKGAFTGAVQDRPGRIRKAHTGTLFLDEIGELDVSTQAKLLKVLEDKILIPVGSEERIPIDVRLIVATNRDLESMVLAGSFRRDLFERIRHVLLRIPPLRKRRSEIPAIVQCVVDEWNKNNHEEKSIGQCIMKRMFEYEWPGNIRELINVVKYACALCAGGAVTLDHLPEYVTGEKCAEKAAGPALPSIPENGVSLKDAMRDFEWGYFQTALKRSGGNTVKAAALLNMSGHTFRKALRERFAQRFMES